MGLGPRESYERSATCRVTFPRGSIKDETNELMVYYGAAIRRFAWLQPASTSC